MHQLEIQYFFPLTEQIILDLDFKPCKEYEDEKRRQWLAESTVTSGQYLIAGNGIGTATTWAAVATDNSFNIMPEGSVGYWMISSNTKLHRKERPNWLHQKMTKVFFGWEWKDK